MLVPAFCAVVLLLAAACSSGEEKEGSQSSLTPVSRPIVDIVPAASIAGDGQPVNPALVFTPDASQITVVAQVGAVRGSAMDITWSEVTDEGEKELFKHTVAVASFEVAYSVGKSPGTLRSGTYRVEATLAGESLSTQFDVEAPETGATGRSATAGPPASGDSGVVAPPTPAGSPEVLVAVFNAPVDPGPPDILVYIEGRLPGGGGRLEGKATMGGNTRTVSYPIAIKKDSVADLLHFNPCDHPGGSDLPGTQATFEAALYKGDEFLKSDTHFTTLGPDETKPEITINSEPPNKSRVEPGDEILLDATAQENRDGPTWQEGLRSFKLISRPGGLVGEEQRSDSPVAQPCGRKQWSLATQGTYHVPDDAPLVIKICGVALDFAGNFNDPTKCNEYYTGEVWEGPLTGQFYAPACSGGAITGNLKIVVGDNGMVTGSVTEKRAAFSCEAVVGTAEGPALERTNQFTGRKTAGAFELSVYGVVVTLPIVGTHATATSDHPGAPGWGVKYTYTVDCVSCG